MGHQHHWRLEPPEGRLFFNKTFDERYGDDEDMASNSMLTSPEEIQRLRQMLKKDPSFQTSSSWPNLVEWCSSCPSSRLVRLVLPKEEVAEEAAEEEQALADDNMDRENACCEAPAKDACTQTPRQKPRRKGGRGSRTRRMLDFQLMLCVKRGLPLSRLLSQLGTDARSSRTDLLKMQEESTPSKLRAERVEIKVEKQEESVTHTVKEEKEEKEFCPSAGVSAGGSTFPFTPRNFQAEANLPSFQPPSHAPVLTPYLFTSPFFPSSQTPQFALMPAVNWVVCGACHTMGTIIPFC